jgi:N-acetylmuramoyl-L-alanine amidase
VHTAEVLAPLAAASVSVALAAGVSAAPPVVVVDPGHDLRANPATEPIGPGSAVRKIKDGGGTAGEPQVVLAISLRLRTMLERAGVRVVMTRTRTAGTSLGNVARARIANRAGAVLFLRVHADGSSNAAQRGTHTLYPAARRGWTDDIAAPSLRAAQLVQVELVRALGLPDRGLDRRSDTSGTDSSWCSSRWQTSRKCGRPRSSRATTSPSSTRPVGRSASSSSCMVMFQPRRLWTRRPSSVDTIARKPSHFTSYAQPLPVGSSPLRASIGRSPTRRA